MDVYVNPHGSHKETSSRKQNTRPFIRKSVTRAFVCIRKYNDVKSYFLAVCGEFLP